MASELSAPPMASVFTSKPANDGRFKGGQRTVPRTGSCYTVPASVPARLFSHRLHVGGLGFFEAANVLAFGEAV
jgi:hypothetical protein